MDKGILELLAEMLRKQDLQNEILIKHSEILERHSLQFEQIAQILLSTQNEIKNINTDVGSLKTDVKSLNYKLFDLIANNVMDRLLKLEDTVFKK